HATYRGRKSPRSCSIKQPSPNVEVRCRPRCERALEARATLVKAARRRAPSGSCLDSRANRWASRPINGERLSRQFLVEGCILDLEIEDPVEELQGHDVDRVVMWHRRDIGLCLVLHHGHV